MTGYERKTTEQLIYNFIWEKGRKDKKDMAISQSLITKELMKRFSTVMNLLEQETDPEAAQGIMKRLLEG